MLPVVIIAAATAAAQYYQSEKARGASEKRLKDIEAEFQRLVPPEYNVSVMDPPQYIKQAIPEPTMDMKSITPEQFKLVGKYSPQVAPLILEQRPELIKETANAKEGRQSQLDALRKLKTISQMESDPELAQQMANANRQSQIQSQSRQQSLLQDLARRGMLSSGMGVASQMQAGSDSMERAALQSQAAAAESYRNRLAALKDSAAIGGQIRDDDIALEGRNTDIINDFNARTSRARQDWENQRAGVMNQAQLHNLGEEQRVSDDNVASKNKFALAQQDRRDALLKYLHEKRLGERSYQNDIREREANWKRGERDNQNELRSRMYGDRLQALGGKYGRAMDYNAFSAERARDRNQAIQGVGNAAMGGYTSSLDRRDRQDMQDRADRRAYMDKYGYWDEDERRRAEGHTGDYGPTTRNIV